MSQVAKDPEIYSEVASESCQDESKQYAPRGSICDVYNLYQTKPDKNGRTSWTKELPDDLVIAAENSESGQYVVTVRNKKCYDGRKPLQIDSILVQSEPLKKFLASVMKDYPGLTMTLERVEFGSPFVPFVHRWEQFTSAREAEQDPTTRSHADLLYKVLEEELRHVISQKNDLVRNGVITHQLLWMIYEKGVVVISTLNNRQRAFIFKEGSVDCRSGAFVLDCKFVDWDGDSFGWDSCELDVPSFEGTLPITDLPVVPLVFHSEQAAVRRDLIARGRLWEEHSGYHYKDYESLATTHFGYRQLKFNVKSRVIIDTEAYNIFHTGDQVSLSSQVSEPALSDEQRLVATPMLRGYSLNDKKWLEFYIDGVKDIVWNSKAFDSLVLPHAQQDLKQLILAFAKARSKNADESFDDVIQGKGRGVIMLLSGPPGVGKTLTAESVAEVMKVPLYVLSAGALGTEAETVEEKLKEVLFMIPKWKAVLLLDEADVFMEARTAADLQRNELVSIFLRMLEYYEGILFLTSNRAENIDPAFESRIDISLRYSDLTESARHRIWTQFIGDAKEGFSSAELEQLSKAPLNGRQIKNILKTAHLLAREQEKALDYRHVDTILSLRALS